MGTPRKPIPHSDAGSWGEILNEFLSVSLADDGKLKPGSVTPVTISDNSISETKLDSNVRAKLNSGSGGSQTLQPHATSHAAGQSDEITPASIGAQPAGNYAPALGSDDNYVTDAEKVKLSNLSGVNTGDQVLPTWTTLSGKPAVIAAGATQADARDAIGAPDIARVEAVVVHDGSPSGGTRPTGFARVRWVGGTTRPTNMAVGDIWEHDV